MQEACAAAASNHKMPKNASGSAQKEMGGTYNLFVVIIEFGRFIQAPRSATLCASD
jgi:hypothetical protein